MQIETCGVMTFYMIYVVERSLKDLWILQFSGFDSRVVGQFWALLG